MNFEREFLDSLLAFASAQTCSDTRSTLQQSPQSRTILKVSLRIMHAALDPRSSPDAPGKSSGARWLFHRQAGQGIRLRLPTPRVPRLDGELRAGRTRALPALKHRSRRERRPHPAIPLEPKP